DISSVFLAIILLPCCQFIIAAAIFHSADELAGFTFRGTISQRVQRNRFWYPGERITLCRTAQHRPLPIQPNEITEKDHPQQTTGPQRNAQLCARNLHIFLFSLAFRKGPTRLLPGKREGTCTNAHPAEVKEVYLHPTASGRSLPRHQCLQRALDLLKAPAN